MEKKKGDSPQIKTVKKSVRFHRLDKWLNEMGLNGWELYDSVTSYKGKYRLYTFWNTKQNSQS